MRFISLIASDILLLFLIGLIVNNRLTHPSKSEFTDFLIVGIGVAVILFTIYSIYRSLIRYRKNIPESDEMSKRLFEVASSQSFTVSLFVWPALFLLSRHNELSMGDFLLIGLSSMIFIFTIFRYRLLKQGITG